MNARKLLLSLAVASVASSAPARAAEPSDSSGAGSAEPAAALNLAAAAAAGEAERGLQDVLPTLELELRFSDNYKPVGRALFVAPLVEQEGGEGALFTQGSISHFDDRLTTNLGLGYRRLLLDKRLLVGTNAFYDHEWDYHHDRASIGAEVRTTIFEVNANYYLGLSGWRDSADGFEERAMDGYDVELAAPLPYLPTTRLSARHFEWKAQSGDFRENGREIAFEAEVLAGLTLAVGHRYYDKQDNEDFGAVRVDVLDVWAGDDDFRLVADQAYALSSMEPALYDKVRRENLIRKERRGINSFAVTASGF
ncbi:MAG: inverse autotransporter beta domain-containing protein [Alphaproteobacteria bacterium]|nr:inverse autotransporter beta domain-containing protein [Alphaproteobacteria bacterium]